MAEPTAPAVPSFVSTILSAEDAKAVLAFTHPDYDTHQTSWQILIDAFEGTGGFLDGSYLWQYPREDTNDYNARKAQQRYHNYLSPLVDLYTRFLFTQGVKRESTSEDYNAWTEDVDGAGTDMNGLLKRLLSMALVCGHAGVLIDKTAEAPTGPSKADDKARVVAHVFTATAIRDWRFTNHVLTAVKLTEAAPEVGIADEALTGPEAEQTLIWTTDGWARFDADGKVVAYDQPNLGMVPFVVFRPTQSYTSPMLGRPLTGHANILVAIDNRDSEEDEVIRAQAFSVLTVSVPEGGDVEQAKEQLGNVIGAAKAIVVQGEIDYKTPDQAVPEAIRKNRAYLVQELYRAAHVRLKSEGLQAESGDSIRLQYTELNEALQGIAKWLSQVETQIARCFFAWQMPTPEAAQAAFEAAAVEAVYPSEFFQDALLTDLEAWAEAVRMDLGPTMTARIKRTAVSRIDPDIPADELEKIHAEIEAAANEPEPDPMVPDRGDPEAAALAAAEQAVNGAQ